MPDLGGHENGAVVNKINCYVLSVWDSEDAPAAVTAEKTARTGRLPLVAVGVISMLAGAAAATGVLLVTGLPGQPVHSFSVNVYLDNEVTADQRAAIEAALPAFDPVGEVKFETREQAWENFQRMTKDYPEVLRDSKMEYMPESFRFETRGRLFDCTGFTKVRHMPGVEKIQVIQHRVSGYGATITCDAEYAKP